jgi:hypothetical protein
MQIIVGQVCTAPAQSVFARAYCLIIIVLHTKLKPNFKNSHKTNHSGNNLYILLRFITFI